MDILICRAASRILYVCFSICSQVLNDSFSIVAANRILDLEFENYPKFVAHNRILDQEFENYPNSIVVAKFWMSVG